MDDAAAGSGAVERSPELRDHRVVCPTPELVSEFRRHLATIGDRDLLHDDTGLGHRLPELRWFAEGLLSGLASQDGLRRVAHVAGPFGRSRQVLEFHVALAAVLRQLLLHPHAPPVSPIGRHHAGAAARSATVVWVVPIPGRRVFTGMDASGPVAAPLTGSRQTTMKVWLEPGDALWCDGARHLLAGPGTGSL